MQRKRILLLIAIVFVSAFVGAFGAFAVLKSHMKNVKEPEAVVVFEEKEKASVKQSLGTNTGGEKWQEGMVEYQGKNYLYNQQIKTYLFMGIDREEEVFQAEDGMSGGQSDAMFLLVVNPQKRKNDIIAIHRNTMADIEVYDEEGQYEGLEYLQICLQHGYGDGMRQSCNRSVSAVSSLFYDIPIAGYFAMNMGGIPKMNDAIGGVTLTIEQNVDSMKEGQTLTLSGEQAYSYIRNRDLNKFDSASDRLNRQIQYIQTFLTQAKDFTRGSSSEAMKLYEEIQPYVVTDIDLLSLFTDLNSYGFTPKEVIKLPGETVQGELFEQYLPDEDAFYQLILEVFYNEVP